MGNSFNTEPSFIKEHKAAVSSFLKQYSGRPSRPPPPKPQPECLKQIQRLILHHFHLEDADARVRETWSLSKPVSYSRKKDLFHKARSRVAHKTPKAKTSRKLRKERTLSRMMLARRPCSLQWGVSSISLHERHFHLQDYWSSGKSFFRIIFSFRRSLKKTLVQWTIPTCFWSSYLFGKQYSAQRNQA